MIGLTRVLQCVCGGHYYRFTLYDEEWNGGNSEIYIEFLTSAQHVTWGRLRWAWYVFRTGYTGSAGIELTLADRDQLVEMLNNPEVWGANFYTEQ